MGAGSVNCPVCGTASLGGSSYCGNCGTPLAAAAETPASTDQTAVASGQAQGQPVPGQPMPGQPIPAAAPGAPGVYPPAPPPSSGGFPWKTCGVIAAIFLLIALIAGALIFVFATKALGQEVTLESTAATGDDPFTPPVAPESAPSPSSTSTPKPTGSPGAPTSSGGSTAPGTGGPFGGSGDNRVCDREALIAALTSPSYAEKAREWARVRGISVSEIPTYIRNLIPTTLSRDTRVTNYRWERGRAVGYQAVLQAGTAVLVDTYGNLVVRCRCGNPLTPPSKVSKPRYSGPKWPGFDPNNVTTVQPAPTPIYSPGGPHPSTPMTTGSPTPTKTSSASPTKTSSPSPAAGGSEKAVQLLKDALSTCATAQGGSLVPISYDTTPASRSNTWSVTATASDGTNATWDVEITTGNITARDELAGEISAICDNF